MSTTGTSGTVSAGRTPKWRQHRHERFARAVDASGNAATGTAVTGPAERPDPKLAGELAIVMMLRRAAGTDQIDGPGPDARARMRRRVLAGVVSARPHPAPSPMPRNGHPVE